MLGTVHSFAAANETLSGSALRDAFGPELASTGSLPGPFGYVGALGYYHDPDLALPLLSIRHYAPTRGMFISRDRPRALRGYGYVRGLPTTRRDPSGLWGLGVGVTVGLGFTYGRSVIWVRQPAPTCWKQCEYETGCVGWFLEAKLSGHYVISVTDCPDYEGFSVVGGFSAVFRGVDIAVTPHLSNPFTWQYDIAPWIGAALWGFGGGICCTTQTSRSSSSGTLVSWYDLCVKPLLDYLNWLEQGWNNWLNGLHEGWDDLMNGIRNRFHDLANPGPPLGPSKRGGGFWGGMIGRYW
jgi:RHS repeat-associated protein